MEFDCKDSVSRSLIVEIELVKVWLWRLSCLQVASGDWLGWRLVEEISKLKFDCNDEVNDDDDEMEFNCEDWVS